jgi:hypothetical protein
MFRLLSLLSRLFRHRTRWMFFPCGLTAQIGARPSYSEVSGWHKIRDTHTHPHGCTQQATSERVISPSQRPHLQNTQQTQETNIHVISWIRTCDSITRAAGDLHLRLHGHWDRLDEYVYVYFPVALWPNAGHDLLVLEGSRSYTTNLHSR